jgi:alcohol dehydrogenase (cytochrome c)
MIAATIYRKLLLASAAIMVSSLAASPTVSAADEPATGGSNIDWPSYNNGFQSQRYSPLTRINSKNVSTLKEVCHVKVQDGGSFHTGPIVVDGTMYLTTARDTIALDPRTCQIKWRNTYTSSHEDVWPVNRGVAYMNGRLFRGTPDGALLAIDATTGKTIWQDTVGNPNLGEFLSGVPVAWNGVVYAGTAGSDWGVRGRVMAFDANDGRELWRFNLIPTGKEAGAESWQNKKSALTGGGGTWTTFALDVTRDELAIPVGNPAPDLDAEYRPGDNLYTDSIVVLDARTGALKWYHQLKAHDGVDHDLAASPVLYRTPDLQDIVAMAGKDGLLVGIDRETHNVLFRTPITTIENENAIPTEQGDHVCPGLLGGVEWNGPAYDRKHNALVTPAVDWCALFKKGAPKYVAGELFYGGDPVQDPADKAHGWITSVDAASGKVNWKHEIDAPVIGAVTPTAGGVTFGGDTKGNFFALDSASGKSLFSMPTQGMIAGGIITYQINDKQYVALTSGNVSRITFGELGDPTIIVMGLGEPSDNASTH